MTRNAVNKRKQCIYEYGESEMLLITPVPEKT